MKKYLYLIGAMLFLTLVGVVKYQYSHNQELKAQKTILEAKSEIQEKQIKRFANRPRTDDDVVVRLCQWAAVTRKKSGDANRPVPGGACDRVP